MSAEEELRRIEEATDWGLLCEQALADPPSPHTLKSAIDRWGSAFQKVHSGSPCEADFPESVRLFFSRIAYADYSPELWNWVKSYTTKNGRSPTFADLPEGLKVLVPTADKPRGRPRCDTRRFIAARLAWERASLEDNYNSKHLIIETFGRLEVTTQCFGHTKADMAGDYPSSLALETLSDETGKSVDRVKDVLWPRARQRKNR